LLSRHTIVCYKLAWRYLYDSNPDHKIFNRILTLLGHHSAGAAGTNQ